jgi:hypothetical protein
VLDGCLDLVKKVRKNSGRKVSLIAIAKRMAHEGAAVVLVDLGEPSLSAATQGP